MGTELQKVTSEPVIGEMAKGYGLDAETLVGLVVRQAMPKEYTQAELIACMMVAHELKLNPLRKEIYFMRNKKGGGVQPIVGVDGWIAAMNKNQAFDGVEFEDSLDEKGNLVSITCKIFRKDRSRPVTCTEYLKECQGTSDPWRKLPARMLRHRALIQCSRIAFGMAGVMEWDEFKQWQGGNQNAELPRAPVDITPAAKRSNDGFDYAGRWTAYACKKDQEKQGKYDDLMAQIRAVSSIAKLNELVEQNTGAHKSTGVILNWMPLPREYAEILDGEVETRKLFLEQEAQKADDFVDAIIDGEALPI